MTPSIWSVLIIFVAAPLALAGLVTLVVLLTTSPSRPFVEADEAAPEEGDDSHCAGDADEADSASE